MTILLIDSGNSRVKFTYYEVAPKGQQVRLGEVLSVTHVDFLKQSALPKLPTRIIISNVASKAFGQRLSGLLTHLAPNSKIEWFTRAPASLLKIHYSPQLGSDRIAAALAVAHADQASASYIVACAGTATTLDWVQCREAIPEFMGGVIIPGIALMRRALAHQTAQLPDQSPAQTAESDQLEESVRALLSLTHWPQTTEDALAAGTWLTHLGVIENLCRRVSPQTLIISGGFGQLLQQAWQNQESVCQSEYRDNLCLIGLAVYAGHDCAK